MSWGRMLALALIVALVGSCATVQQNIDARAYLARCTYELAGLGVNVGNAHRRSA